MYFLGYLTPDEKLFKNETEYYSAIDGNPNVVDKKLDPLGNKVYEERSDFHLLIPNLGPFQPPEPHPSNTNKTPPIGPNAIFGAVFLTLFLSLASLSGTPTIETIANSVAEMPLFKGGLALLFLYMTIRFSYSATRGLTLTLLYELKEMTIAMFYFLAFLQGLLFHREELIDNYRKIRFYNKHISPDPVDPTRAAFTGNDDEDSKDGASPLPT